MLGWRDEWARRRAPRRRQQAKRACGKAEHTIPIAWFNEDARDREVKLVDNWIHG